MELSEYTEGRVRKHGQADVAFKWEDKPQKREPMPERSQTLYRQGPESQQKRTYEVNNKGWMIPVPAKHRHNNAWRKRSGLKGVEFVDGKWWYLLVDTPGVSQRKAGPRIVTPAGEEVLDRMAAAKGQPAREAVTHQERMLQTELIQPPPTGVVDAGRDFEGDTFTLTEDGHKAVQSILNTYVNKQEFLEKMADRIAEHGKGELAHQLVKFAEAGRPGQPSLSFKRLIKTPAGRLALKSWAKRVSPKQWQAVVEHAEDILATANRGNTGRRFRVKVEQAEKTATQVPTDLPIAYGKDELIALINRKDNGLTKEVREKGLKLLREIDPELGRTCHSE
jgi:hypothetical protein